MNRTLFIAFAVALILVPGITMAQQSAPAVSGAPSIIPKPVSMTLHQGRFTITKRTVIWTDAASVSVGQQLARYLEPATGLTLRVQTGGTMPSAAIVLRREPGLLKKLGTEGYVLDVRPARVIARAGESNGLFYAVQTMRQLLPPAIFRGAPVTGVDWAMPAVTIEDAPRFSWRGAHLDVGRHFMPKEFIKKYIDLLALHKLNTFHWHLTEDQGWRLEIKRYPKLTEVGAWRKETIIGHQPRDRATWQFDKTPHGGFYTQDDAREIVAYGKARFVNVVPEIEMPGHSVAAIASYPEIGVTGQPIDVATYWGVFSDILNAEPSTVQFMQNVLSEVLQIFPSRYIHIGGDEADKTKWKASPRIQARIKELGLADEHQLQSWFIRQMDGFLTAHNRRLVGWDEILEGGLAENAVVMSWRGTTGGISAARAGHDVIMAPESETYLNYYQTKDQVPENPAHPGFLPLEKVYAFEPVPAELEAQFTKHILGAQAQIWTEYLPGPKNVEYQAFPRLTALAEVVWTPKDQKNYDDYLARLAVDLQRLQVLDVNYFRGSSTENANTSANTLAAADPFTGTWKLNQAKSHLPSPSPKDVVSHITIVGASLDLREEITDDKGDQHTVTFKAATDGKFYPVSNYPQADSVAYERVDVRTIKSTSMKDGKVLVHETVVLSPDGKSFMATYSGNDAQGKPVTGTAVFDKQ
jgi:hexosaminidase